MEQELDLNESFKIIDDPDFLSMPKRELEEASDILPLADFCEHSGWPDDDTLEINVIETFRSNTVVRVKATLCFSEIIPTGCSELSRRDGVVGLIEIEFNREEKSAYILEVDG
jgi:hypothetical protein